MTDTAKAYKVAAFAAREACERADDVSNAAWLAYEEDATKQEQKKADTSAAESQAACADAEATAGRAAYEDGDVTEALLRASYSFAAAAAANRHAGNSEHNVAANAAAIEARSCAQAAAIHSMGR